MNIKDYANDVNLSVAEIIKKCHELGIKADANYELTDDDIILLDNTLNLISTDKETTYEEEDAIDDVVMQVMESENIDKSTSNSQNKQKLKKKDSVKDSKDFKNLKKEMYKHKSKLMGNKAEKDVVLYTSNMTVSDLANALSISNSISDAYLKIGKVSQAGYRFISVDEGELFFKLFDPEIGKVVENGY